MSNISAWAIRKPVPAIMLFIVLTLAGWASFLRLPVNANPNVSFPIVTVAVSQASAAPAELENQVTRRIEGAASGLAGVSHIRSTIGSGISTTTVEFRIGTRIAPPTMCARLSRRSAPTCRNRFRNRLFPASTSKVA